MRFHLTFCADIATRRLKRVEYCTRETARPGNNQRRLFNSEKRWGVQRLEVIGQGIVAGLCTSQCEGTRDDKQVDKATVRRSAEAAHC